MGGLVIDWCNFSAAKYAVMRWHYSKRMPAPPRACIGVWENNIFIGTIIFSRGASAGIGSPYKLSNTECVELTRVALGKHEEQVSRILSIAIKKLKRKCPPLRLIVSYADPWQGHMGKIYQAGNWIYTGQTAPAIVYFDESGKEIHNRSIGVTGYRKQFGVMKKTRTPDELQKTVRPPKYRYLYPLDSAMRKRILLLSRPYPSAHVV